MDPSALGRSEGADGGRVADLMEVPTPGLLVRRSAPEGVGTKSTKGRRSRRVPLANRILPTVRRLAEGKEPSDLLLTTSRGARLHRSAVLRSLRWSTTGQGRRIHDLRHTAACLWLARGVDPGTVQAWMGHEPIATTNLYLHFLGTGADRVGLELLNLPRGAPGGKSRFDRWITTAERIRSEHFFALVRRGIRGGAACRNRTDDLLITSGSSQ